MSARPKVAVLFRRIGPYHLARLEAAGARCALTAVEFSRVDRTYACSQVEGAPNFTRLTLFADEDVDRKRRTAVAQQRAQRSCRRDPDVVAIPGWSQSGALSALLWCLRTERPAVLMSDSGMRDEARRRAREAIKRTRRPAVRQRARRRRAAVRVRPRPGSAA